MKRFLILLSIVFIWTCSSPTKSEPAPQPPTVNNLSITTNEDTPTTFTMSGVDPEGAALTFSISTQPQNGTVKASGAAGTYTPNENFNGADTFAYIASDGALSSTAGLVTVTVTAVDDDPNTMNVSAVTDEDNAVVITLEVEEYDGDTISFNIKDNPTSGTVTLNGDKAKYTPNANYYGADSFTFEAVDTTAKKILNTATASITINPINDAPTATDVEADAFDNQSIDIDLPVEDVDEDNLSIQIVDNPSEVTLSLNGSAVTVYNPNHYWGTDSFTYQAYDGTTYSETKTVSLGLKRNVNYNIPSSDFTNSISPWFNLAGIVDGLGFSKNDSYNTNAAYADFNGDNYFDIMIQPNVNDGVPVNTYFLINNGDNTFYIDDDFPININTSAISSRKTIVGDFNLDGKPDVVRPQGGHDWTAKPTITLSSDNGYNFDLIHDAPAELQAHGLCSGDIDNDGDLDIFFANAGSYDGFAINDGNGNFSWKWITEVIDGMDSGWTYPDGGYGYYGFWTSDMSDIDNDGFVDIILGGTYKDVHYDPNLDGATILWGNGSGSYSFNRATVLFVARELDYINYSNGQKFSTQDFAIADINQDGLKDIALKNPFISDGNFHQVFLAKGNRVFEDVTLNVFNGIFKFDYNNYVWLNLRDLDNNGLIELIEQEPVISVPTHIFSSGWRNSYRWEWNGSSFTRIQ
jgi:hypothetical protein